MKRFTLALGCLAILMLVLLSVPHSWGQVITQQSATMLNVCNGIQHGDAAVNTTVTLTITPPSGQYVYLCGWDYQVTGNATGTAQSNVTWTTTGLPGTPKWQYSNAVGAQVSTYGTFYFRAPVKSNSPGTAVTIVSPAVAAQSAYSANAYFYYAP